MADKYCDPTLSTGANDGTSTANAWQNLEQVLRNTIASGSYSAGDRIIVRTYNGGNITVNLSAGAFSQAVKGTVTDHVVFEADDGTTWGTGGVLTISKNDDNTPFTFAQHTTFRGHANNLRFYGGMSAATHGRAFGLPLISGAAVSGKIKFQECEFTRSDTNVSVIGITFSSQNNSNLEVEFEKCRIHRKSRIVNNTYGLIASNAGGQFRLRVRGGTYDFAGSDVNCPGLFTATAWGQNVDVEDLVCENTAVGHILVWWAGTYGASIPPPIRVKNVDLGLAHLPSNHVVDAYATSSQPQPSMETGCIEEDINGIEDYFSVTGPMGQITWNPVGNFPTLNAIGPDDASTPWSWRCFPSRVVTKLTPMKIDEIRKFWNGATGQVEVTVEILIKDTSVGGGSGKFDSPQKDEWFITVSYFDNTTSARISESSVATGALASSSAAWSTDVYGANSYNKHAITLTTTGDVLADTAIVVCVYSGKSTDDVTDFYFVDPDPSLAAV